VIGVVGPALEHDDVVGRVQVVIVPEPIHVGLPVLTAGRVAGAADGIDDRPPAELTGSGADLDRAPGDRTGARDEAVAEEERCELRGAGRTGTAGRSQQPEGQQDGTRESETAPSHTPHVGSVTHDGDYRNRNTFVTV
jgi:hypothetical protein